MEKGEEKWKKTGKLRPYKQENIVGQNPYLAAEKKHHKCRLIY